MVLTDSSFAVSMNAHVLTTSTSASAGFAVNVWPPSCDSPIITSESTRFFGHPSETKPILINESTIYPGTWNLRCHSVHHAGECSGFADMLEAADPSDDPFYAHTETAVRDRTETPQIEIPLEGCLREIVILYALQEHVVACQALAAPDDFADTLWREHVDA